MSTRAPPRRTAHVATAPQPRAATSSHAFSSAPTDLPDLVATDRAHDTKGNGQAAAARGMEGRAGAPHAPRDRGHVATQNIGEEPQLAKAAQLERARHAGVLGSTQMLDETFRSLTGDARITSGFDAHDVTATLAGGDGAALGAFGMGRRGVGVGDDGLGDTIGTRDSRGSFSVGTGRGHAWGGTVAAPTAPTWAATWNGPYTDASYHANARLRRPPLLTICGEPYRARCRVTGDLDPAIVRRYVKRQATRLQHCYEHQLLAEPSLAAGPLFVDFAIAADGQVVGARTTGLDPTVASCVRDVFAQLAFPAAGATHVEYVLVYRRP